MRIATLATAVGAALALGACGDAEDSSGAPARTATSAPAAGSDPRAEDSSAAAASAAGVTIKSASSDFGTILFNRRGQAIYLFDREERARSECYGACAQAWPPVLTAGRPRAAGRTRPSLLGTIRRRNGKRQVTYAGHPLYYYAHERPGQVLCQGVDEFGGLWLVVKPDGAPVR